MNSTCELGSHSARALKPYPAYKDSGVQWLGKVPSHWAVRRIRTIASVISGATPSSNTGSYWDGDIVWVTPHDLGALGSRYTTTSARRITRKGYEACGATMAPAGSVAISTRAPIGHIGILSSAACTNQGCRLLVPNGAIQPEHLYYSLKVARPELESLGQGSTFAELSRDELARFAVPVAPRREQVAIARFLDHADRPIRRYIRAKQKLIALLEEQKQALIHEAVTGRIDVRTGRPYSAYKGSGVEWLGTVPEHWDVLPLKRAFVSMDYGISDTGTEDGRIAVLTMGDVGRNGAARIPELGGVAFIAPKLLLRDKDLLFNRTNSAELVGKVGLFRSGERAATFASYLVRMRARQENRPEFLNFVLNDAGFLASGRREAIPSLHQANLNPTRYGRLPIPLPGTAEQETAIAFIGGNVSKMDAAVEGANREIDLFQEYRTRLIDYVVTGKIDVREAAAGLPEVAPVAEDNASSAS